MNAKRLACLLLLAGFALTVGAAPEAEWVSLFNGKDLSGWDKWMGPKSSGYQNPKTAKEPPIGLNNDPFNVFTVTEKDGAPAIHVSGQIFGAITCTQDFGNVHIRVEYKWGAKKWPPRDQPNHYPDSGVLYWAIGEQGAGSYAWMRSVECNIMQKGVGQWWGVDGTYVDIEGRKVVLENEPSVPYRGEGKGEQCIVWQAGGKQFTTGEGITSPFDPEKTNEWNICEVYAWGNVCIHMLNGQVVLVLTNPRYRENGREMPLTHGRIQLQSEGAEIFFRNPQARTITEIPANLLPHIPRSAPDETGFQSLLGKEDAPGWTQCGPGHFTVTNGVATAHDGMGLWWQTNRVYTNFVIRGEFLQEQEIADSGVFVRFPDPGNDPWIAVRQGHEMEIGDPNPKTPTWRTGSLYPHQAAVKDLSRPVGQWNDFEMTVTGPNYSMRLNGEVVATWTDPKPLSTSGHIGLQNYNDKKTVRFRNLRVKDLP